MKHAPLSTALIAVSLIAAGSADAQSTDQARPAVQAKHAKVATESVEVSEHHIFNTNEPVDGATILVRDYINQEVNATVSSRALDPDTAYSIWWAVFNRPQYCRQPYRCGVKDLEVFGGDPRINASVFWGGGFISDNFGMANTSLRLVPGRTTRELFARSKPYGLRNFRQAEIHLVIRTHGPAGVAGPIAQQIGTATEACPEDGCQNVFASIHSAVQPEGN